jgi:hypothetical protein
MIKEKMSLSYLDRVQSLLPKQNIQQNKYPNLINDKFSNGRRQMNRADPQSRYNPRNSLNRNNKITTRSFSLTDLPFKPQRKHVQWLSASQQERNSLTLSDELIAFFNYVSVS